ncbi:MAG: DUF6503 family protein [Cyclobacteriaceae bacterium]
MADSTKQKINRQKEDVKTPLSFLLEVKDLTNPITIKRMQLLKAGALLVTVAVCSYFVWEHYMRAATGEELVAEWVDAAGGMEAWNNIDHGQYLKTHKLFSETGELLNERSERIFFEKVNGNVKLMADVETDKGLQVIIAKDEMGYWAVENNNQVDPGEKARELGMSCENHWCEPDCSMNMAFYRFSMPFKLTDNGVIAENGGEKTLDGKKAQVLNISYEEGVGRDKWVFMAHPNEKLIRKMEYHQNNQHGDVLPVEFIWSDHANEGGIMVSHRWTRYWSNGKVLEEYVYSDFDFQSPLPQEFYSRPSRLASAF